MCDIYVANKVIAKSAECTKAVYIAFVDQEKEFDSALTAAVLEALQDKGIEETYIRFLEDI